MNDQQYVDKVRESYILSFLWQVEDPAFQQDIAHPHIERRSVDRFAKVNVNLLLCSPRSPNLWHELQIFEDTVPQTEIDHLVESMPQRAENCIYNKEDNTII